jgi:pimeloyl-ACP methyl ester carboxylesterase
MAAISTHSPTCSPMNSRSSAMTGAGTAAVPSRPAGGQPSPEEQADDAAALLNALGTGPAAVFGTSSGGNFALCLLVRHPAWVRGAILHEPGLYALVDVDAVRAPLRALVQEAMERGGPPAAVERFWCYVAGTTAGTA